VRPHHLAVALACSIIVAAPAAAQTTRNGLFAATRAGADVKDRLTFQMSLSESLDSEVPVEFRSLQPGNLAVGRYSNVFSGTADYLHSQRHVDLRGSASSYLRYNYALRETVVGPQSGQLGATFHLPGTGSLSVGEDASYSPSYLYELFPGDVAQEPEAPAPVNPDYRIDTAKSYSYRSRAALSYGDGIGTRVSATAEYRLADYRGHAIRPDLNDYEAGATISHAPSRSKSFSAGYYRRSGRYGSNPWTNGQELRLGLRLSPALSVSRRVTFDVTVTPTLVDRPTSAIAADDALPAPAEQRRYLVQGSAGVNYPFKLTWTMSAGYRRGVDYLAVLTEPVVSDAGTVGLAGIIGRRAMITVDARYGTSAALLAQQGQRLRTATGDARFRFALSRSIALFTEYLYYYYDRGAQRVLAADLPDAYDQHSVRIGVMLFAQPINHMGSGRVRR
jgi:hypothetical protein